MNEASIVRVYSCSIVVESEGLSGLGFLGLLELEMELPGLEAAEFLEGVFAGCFPVEELLFAGGVPAEAAEFSRGCEDTVAGDKDAEGVGADGVADGTGGCGLADVGGDSAVVRRLVGGDFQEFIPYGLLEWRALGGEQDGLFRAGYRRKDFLERWALWVFRGIGMVEFNTLEIPLPCCEGKGSEGGWKVMVCHVFHVG